jgi:uncharacterized membrane protein
MAKNALQKALRRKSKIRKLVSPGRSGIGPIPGIGRKKKSPIGGLVGPALGAAGTFGAARAARYLAGQGKKAKDNLDQASMLKDKASDVQEAVAGKKTGVGKAFAAVKAVGGGDQEQGSTANTKLRHIIQEYIDVGVTRETAYNQWTQFKEFPKLFKAVEQAEQDDRDKLEWEAKIGPSRRKWQAEITKQVPDQRIEWKSVGGADNHGVVSFHSLDENLTRVLVQMEYHPKGVIEQTGNLFRMQRRRVRRELRLFKHFLELRDEETGSWRGRINKEEDLTGYEEEDSGNGSKEKDDSSKSKSRNKQPAKSSS